MRITGGTWRGRPLLGPGKGLETRPTGSRARQALFNVLGPEVIGSRVLDLFAGVGTLGLEALSRGAKQVTFVDASRKNLALTQANIYRLGCEDRARVMPGEVLRLVNYLGRRKEAFDLILCDPPYHWSGLETLALRVRERGLLVAQGLMVLEHSADHHLALEGWRRMSQKRYGDTCLLFMQVAPREEK